MRRIALRFALLSFGLTLGSISFGQSPRIDSVDPPQGPISGGTVVTIKGAGFLGSQLSVDAAAMAAQSLTDAEIRFVAPPHDNGIASIRVANAAASAYGEFLYVPPRLRDLPDGYITTIAGVGAFTGYHRKATLAEIVPQGSPAFDRQGNLYIPEPGFNRVSRLRTDGTLERFAGNGESYFNVQNVRDGGPATDALVNFPRGVKVDDDATAYITESAARVRRVDATTGIIGTIAGNGSFGFSGDGGPATAAQLRDASHITGDGKGTIVFVDHDDVSGGARLRRVTPNGIIATIAGTGTPGFSGDGGPATQAQFNFVFGDRGSLARDKQGNIFVADYGNSRVRRIDAATGIISTVFGPTDGQHDISAIATDESGNIYVGFTSAGITKLGPDGRTLATYGSGKFPGFSEDGTPIANVAIPTLLGLTIDPGGNIVYVDQSFPRVRRLNLATGFVETLAGMSPRIIGDNGPAIGTVLQVGPAGDVAFLPGGDMLVADNQHQLIRRIDVAGNISTFAKGGLLALLDGNPSQWFVSPTTLRTDGAKNIYVADQFNVYRIDAQGATHLSAGVPRTCGFSGDGGPATAAQLCQVWGMALDSSGNLFIADSNNNRIRRVDARTGIITTVAGSGPSNGFEHYGQGSFGGDGGPATQALLNTPYNLAIDYDGNLFIADNYNARIRKVDRNGVINTFVSPINAINLVFDSAGYLYAAANYGGTSGIWRIDSNGNVAPVAGRESSVSLGDGGPAQQARIRNGAQAPGLTIDAEGNIFFVDNGNLRVRAIRKGAVGTALSVNYTGLWWNPSESGWGINLNQQGRVMFATLFTYDAAGNPMWLVMSNGAIQPDGRSFAGDLYRTTGPPFNASPFTPIGPANITRVGTMSIAFSGTHSATLTYSVNGATVTKAIQPQVFGSKAALCQPILAPRDSLPNYQDLWWNPAESGWGVNVTHQDDTVFATLFTYDSAGNGLWLVMSNGARQADGSYAGDLFRTTGSAFNAAPFVPIGPANIAKVGTMRLRFADGQVGTLTYSVNGTNVTKAISRQVFSSPVTSCAN